MRRSLAGAGLLGAPRARASSSTSSIVRTGRTVLTFPHGDYVPVSGNGMRLLLHGFSRLYAVEPKQSKQRRLAR